MKLSEQLIELAEWWITPEISVENPLYHNRLLDDHRGYSNLSLEEITTLCLLEAEFQKDIEYIMDNKEIS